MRVNIASNSGTSTRWPRPVRRRAISAITMLTPARYAAKLEASGRAEYAGRSQSQPAGSSPGRGSQLAVAAAMTPS